MPVVLTSLLLALAGCAGSTNKSTSTSAAAQTGPTTIDQKNVKFVPETVTVKAGVTVTWVNLDDVDHTTTSDDAGGPLNSGNMSKGAQYSYTFATPGTYKYHCHPHAWLEGGAYKGMVGTVVVVA